MFAIGALSSSILFWIYSFLPPVAGGGYIICYRKPWHNWAQLWKVLKKMPNKGIVFPDHVTSQSDFIPSLFVSPYLGTYTN